MPMKRFQIDPLGATRIASRRTYPIANFQFSISNLAQSAIGNIGNQQSAIAIPRSTVQCANTSGEVSSFRAGIGTFTWLAFVGAFLLSIFSARAQFPTSFTYTNDFNGGASSNLTLTGTATINGGYLKLTTQAPGGQLGTAFIDGLSSAQGVRSFRATYRAALFGGT